jgi:Leucine-rich repeat (LRR) protein
MSQVNTLSSLQTLILCSNQIATMPSLSGLTQLTGLDMDNNQIVDMSPVNTLANLQWLSMENNQVSNLPDLSRMLNLSTLDLCSNQITNIGGLQGMSHLGYLYLGNEKGLNNIQALIPAYDHGCFRQGEVDLMNDPLDDPDSAKVIALLTSGGVEVDTTADLDSDAVLQPKARFQEKIMAHRSNEAKTTREIGGLAKKGAPRVSHSTLKRN